MNTLLSIIRNVALLVLISAFWEMLIPAGRLRQTVRLVIGLLLISIIIIPIVEALIRDQQSWALELPEVVESDDILAQGEAISQEMQSTAQSSYEQDLARQVASLALVAEGVAEARAAVRAEAENGAIRAVVVELEIQPGAESSRVKDKVVSLIGTFFGLDEAVIECTVKEAAQDDGTGAQTNE